MRAAAAVLLAALAGNAGAQETDPQALMAQLEARLLGARRIAIEATIEATGAVAASLRGSTEVLERNRASLAYEGVFGGRPAALVLQADGRFVRLRNGGDEAWERVARESNRALVIGLARMGQLHNLARLSGVHGPDHGGGGVDQWVLLDAFRPMTYALGGDLEGTMSFGFDMVVDGRVSGSARLWVDPASGLPRRRQVTVRFPQGDMVVQEDYTRFEIQ